MHCANCGEYIGEGMDKYREPEACDNPECQREVRDMCRQMDSDARERAHDDDYERYR